MKVKFKKIRTYYEVRFLTKDKSSPIWALSTSSFWYAIKRSVQMFIPILIISHKRKQQ